MMSEEKFIELLAEYLRKTDRLMDRVDSVLSRLDSHDVLFEKQLHRIDLAYQVIIGHSEKIESL